MAVVLQIGQDLPTGVLQLKYNSQNDFSLFFWDNAAATVPSNITGAVITIELDDVTLVTGTIVGSTNEVQFSVTQAQSLITTKKDFAVVMVKTAKRYVLLTGEVEIQK